jgi:error-prone DNA polymerase
VELAHADAFRTSLGLARCEALWAIKALRDEPLPLFAAAAAREAGPVAEQAEPIVSLRPMTAGSEVVEDYGHTGLTLRQHPVSFLRADLARRRIVTCAEAVSSRDRRWTEVAGLVLVRQRPGSAKGVMFMTIEDETGVANIVIWQKVFEQHRRIVLGAGMIGMSGCVQREGEVVHIVARRLTDLSADLASIGARDAAFPLPHGRGDNFHHGSPAPDPRELAKPRNLVDPYGHIDEIKVKTRDFR